MGGTHPGKIFYKKRCVPERVQNCQYTEIHKTNAEKYQTVGCSNCLREYEIPALGSIWKKEERKFLAEFKDPQCLLKQREIIIRPKRSEVIMRFGGDVIGVCNFELQDSILKINFLENRTCGRAHEYRQTNVGTQLLCATILAANKICLKSGGIQKVTVIVNQSGYEKVCVLRDGPAKYFARFGFDFDQSKILDYSDLQYLTYGSDGISMTLRENDMDTLIEDCSILSRNGRTLLLGPEKFVGERRQNLQNTFPNPCEKCTHGCECCLPRQDPFQFMSLYGNFWTDAVNKIYTKEFSKRVLASVKWE